MAYFIGNSLLLLFGTNLRYIKKRVKLLSISERLYLNVSEISRIEWGVVNTSLLNLKLISNYLKIDICEFLILKTTFNILV